MKQITITICLDKVRKEDVRDTIKAEVDKASVHITNAVVGAVDYLVKENSSFKDVSVHFMDVKIQNTY